MSRSIQAVIGDRNIGKKREMKVIAEMLADDEPFFGGVSGIYGKGRGILAATDRRLIFASRGYLWGGDMVEEFSYAHIDTLKYRNGNAEGRDLDRQGCDRLRR